jgi:rare lipoprotein A
VFIRAAVIAVAGCGLSACLSTGGHQHAAYRTANLRPYEVDGRRYNPQPTKHYEKKGLASWYSYPAGSRRTASGELFDGRRLAAAHKTLPLPCMVEVTNLDNGRRIKVRVNDRGPFVDGRIIDLTPAAAERLGFMGHGTARVKVKFLGPAPVADSGQIELAQADVPAQAAEGAAEF